MSFARRMLRQWRWWVVLLAALTFHPWLTERRPGGPLDVLRLSPRVDRVEALAESDPAPAEREAAALLKRAPSSLLPRLRRAQARARLRLFAAGESPLDEEEIRELNDPQLTATLEDLRRFARVSPQEVKDRLRREAASAPLLLAAWETLGAGVSPRARARLLFLANRYPEAAEAGRAAGETGLYIEAESLRRMERPEAEPVAVALLRGDSVLAPLGHLVLGRILLRGRDAAGWLHLEEALPILRSSWAVMSAALDRDALYAELREHAYAETKTEGLCRAARVLESWHRVLPSDLPALADAAEIAVRCRAHDLAASLFRRLAESLPAGEARTRSLRRSAEQLLQAERFVDAAEVFHALPDRDARYQEGMAFARAGLTRTALERLQTYIASVAPSDPLVPAAIVERARLLAAEGRPEAAAELDRFFSGWPELAVSPESEECRAALLLKARLELRRGDRDAARRTLREFVERYAPADSGAPRGEVAFARAQLATLEMEAQRWSDVLTLLDQARADLRASLDPSDVEAVELAGIMAGDAYLSLGRAAEARVAYDMAVRALDKQPQWRIVALIGRARAALRLGTEEMREAARKDYARAADLIRQHREKAGPPALTMLENLRRELP
ncbi:MAG: hypothetical protein HYY16_18810 [Planctomycetes bacterium]|nr:hypothetical protein [Planctomycetota bacterium]